MHILLLFFSSLSFSGVLASFHYGNEYIATEEKGKEFQSNGISTLIQNRTSERSFYKNWTVQLNESFVKKRQKRFNEDGTFVGHPKTREERWHATFNLNQTNDKVDQAYSLVTLLNKVIDKYLNACIPIVLYDQYVESSEGIILQTFFQSIKISYLHGRINENFTVINQNLMKPYDKNCRSYIIFLSEVLKTRDVLGPQVSNRVVLISRSTQWKLQEFLSSKEASDIINLLVVGESFTADPNKQKPYVLYTHKLYTDGLGSNTPIVLTSWIRGKLSRPNVNLFPRKFHNGFSSHRFSISAIHQPPFMLKISSTDGAGNLKLDWDGYEMRLMKILSQRLNFTYQVIEPTIENELGRTYGVIDMVEGRQADIGLAGAFVSNERMIRTELSIPHSTDCAAFITLSSKALPRYRAIMGPFQWPVWLAIILTYLFAIVPLAFSDRLTLRHLIGNWGEIENMFWYVFGTFTNSLTFAGEFSWSNTKKTSTRLLIGTYWVFSIIITACYTGSIIAFVTLPVFPDTIDSIDDLISGFYRVGTLAKDGWQYWFTNSSDPEAKRLLRGLEFVSDVDEGLRNVTQAFFWGYAFLGSRSQLQFIVQNNLTEGGIGKKSALHIAEQCLSNFGVSLVFPHNSVYATLFNEAILRFSASGLDIKITNDMAWDLQRSDTQQLLDSSKSKSFSFADVVERKLNLADTEGMFLLMAVGYILAGSVLASEIVGGCARHCRQFVRRRSSTVISFARNTSKRGSITSTAEEYAPRRSFSENLRRRVSDTFRRTSDTEGSFSIRHFFQRKSTVSMKDEEKAGTSNAWEINVSDEDDPKASNFENYLEFNEKVDEQKTDDAVAGCSKDCEKASLFGSSSICSESAAVHEEHVVELNVPPAENRDDNASKEFGEVV